MTTKTAFADSEGYTKSFLFEQIDEILQFFDEYGFVVVRDLIESQSQIEETIDEIWALLRVMNSTIDKNNSSTWDDQYWPTFMGLKAGKCEKSSSTSLAFILKINRWIHFTSERCCHENVLGKSSTSECCWFVSKDFERRKSLGEIRSIRNDETNERNCFSK